MNPSTDDNPELGHEDICNARKQEHEDGNASHLLQGCWPFRKDPFLDCSEVKIACTYARSTHEEKKWTPLLLLLLDWLVYAMITIGFRSRGRISLACWTSFLISYFSWFHSDFATLDCSALGFVMRKSLLVAEEFYSQEERCSLYYMLCFPIYASSVCVYACHMHAISKHQAYPSSIPVLT